VERQPAATYRVLAYLRGEFDPSSLPEIEEPFVAPGPGENAAPDEPNPEPGPKFTLESGKLDIVPVREAGEGFDRSTQIAMHKRIMRRVEALQSETAKVGNQHPSLAHVVKEYADLIGKPFDDLDLVDLWVIGTCPLI
jgi:hypothetical protein